MPRRTVGGGLRRTVGPEGLSLHLRPAEVARGRAGGERGIRPYSITDAPDPCRAPGRRGRAERADPGSGPSSSFLCVPPDRRAGASGLRRTARPASVGLRRGLPRSSRRGPSLPLQEEHGAVPERRWAAKRRLRRGRRGGTQGSETSPSEKGDEVDSEK